MKPTTRGALALAAMLAAGVSGLAAQQPQAGAGPDGPRPRAGVEAIMRLRERLGLSEDQISKLDAIRKSDVQERSQQMAAMAELRSQAAAGQIDRTQLADRMRAQRDSRQDAAEQRRQQLDAILTDAQRDTLQQMQGRARAFARGRASAMRGGRAGPRMGRGAAPRMGPGRQGAGPRAPGFAPRGGRGGAGFGPGTPRGRMRPGGMGPQPAPAGPGDGAVGPDSVPGADTPSGSR